MKTKYHLENIAAKHKENPRQFLKPSDKEIENLKVNEYVRLFFVLDFDSEDGCRAERMWVQISEINGAQYRGCLTNQPRYIERLNLGDVIHFERNNIATVIVAADLPLDKFAIVSEKAWANREANWAVRDEPSNDQDSGWQILYGDEDDEFLENPDNARLRSLDSVLEIEPRLEAVFSSDHNAFEWSEESMCFVEVHDFEGEK